MRGSGFPVRLSRLILGVLLPLCAAIQATAQTLYDATLSSFPDQQGWDFAFNPATPPPLLTLTNDLLTVDTRAANGTQAGYARLAPVELDCSRGFALSFSLRMLAESHTGSSNRAGFSIIVLDREAHGIELGFWTTSVWAQADAPLFVRAENAALSTTDQLAHYVLTMNSAGYALYTEGRRILEGPIRDYQSFSGFPDPYETPNLLFFGDNTSSAQGAWQLGSFSLVLPPVLTASAGGGVSWTSVSNLTFAIEGSTKLTTWVQLGRVTSSSENYTFTNAFPIPPDPRFIRIRFP